MKLHFPATEIYPGAALERAVRLLSEGNEGDAVGLLQAHVNDLGCNDRLRELHLGERRNDEAAAAIRRSPAAPGSAQQLTNRGIELHLAGNFADASAVLRQAAEADGNYAPARNQLGRALFNLGQGPQAVAAFREAVRLDPGYAEAWHNLGHVLRATGAMADAIQAFETALALRPGYRSARIHLGITLFSSDQAQASLACFEALLASDPDDAEALSHSALALHLIGHLQEARRRYERALALSPRLPSAHYYLGALCNELSEPGAAREALRQAIALNPNDADAWAELASVEELSNDVDAAGRAVQSGLRIAATHAQLNIEAAKLERRRGDAALARDRLRRLDPRQLRPRLRQQYYYELGNCLDRTEESAPAWSAFERGNAEAAASLRLQAIDPEAFFSELRALDSVAGELLPQPATVNSGDTDEGSDLCFLLGFPRSGTTLLESVLDKHPDVVSIEEKPTLEMAIQHLRSLPGGYPAAVAALDEGQLTGLRRLYRDAIRPYVDAGGQRVILDKLPMRSIHARFIRRLFPRSRILFAKRHPCDVVVSNFMQQYAANEAFIHFFTLADTVRTYEAVLALWQRLQAQLQGGVHTIGYEDLVAEPARELERVCEFLGIEWQPEILAARQQAPARERVRTNSYHQVAEPIYQRAVARWQRYRPQLEPYLERLRAPADYLGYRID